MALGDPKLRDKREETISKSIGDFFLSDKINIFHYIIFVFLRLYFFLFFKKLIYFFLIGRYLLYNSVLVSAIYNVNQP